MLGDVLGTLCTMFHILTIVLQVTCFHSHVKEINKGLQKLPVITQVFSRKPSFYS